MKNLIKAFSALNLSKKCQNLLGAIVDLGTAKKPIALIAKVSKTGKQGFNILGIDVANKSRLLDIPEVADLLEEVKASVNINYMIFQGDNYDKPGIWIGEKSQAKSLSTEDLKQAFSMAHIVSADENPSMVLDNMKADGTFPTDDEIEEMSLLKKA